MTTMAASPPRLTASALDFLAGRPVHVRSSHRTDLARAGITPAAWVANQTFTATGTTDPVLAARARSEHRWLADVLDRHDQLAVVAWQARPPVGAEALAQLVRMPDPVGAASAPSQA